MKPPAENFGELRQLISQACDGMLTDDEANRLAALLSESSAQRDEYVAWIATDALLEQWASKPLLEMSFSLESERLLQRPSAVEPAHSTTLPAKTSTAKKRGIVSGSRHNSKSSQSRYQITGWGNWLPTIAAASVVFLMGAIWLLRPTPLATLVLAEDATWSNGSHFESGDSLRNQWLDLESGSAKLVLQQSGKIALNGPTRFRVTAPNRAELASGSIAVQAAGDARGLVIESPLLVVEDLSTGFEMSVEPEGRETVVVTEGIVGVRRRAGADSLYLRAGQTIEVKPGELPNQPLKASSVANDNLRFSGQIRFEATHPVSLNRRMVTRERIIHVYLESMHRLLPNDLLVNQKSSGRFANSFNNVEGVIPAGTRVDCFLLHCDPLRSKQAVTGVIVFPREILGVISGSDRLTATNATLGSGLSLQCTEYRDIRGLESEPVESDILVIGKDRRTLSIKMTTGGAIDQIRVLVKSP